MIFRQLLARATNKDKFVRIHDYASFCQDYLEFIARGLQASIVSRNESNYIFYQYKRDGGFAVTRPINSELMLAANEFSKAYDMFTMALGNMRELKDEFEVRQTLNRFVYTCQQSIGATLDALPAGKSNFARKLNGDLFERFVRAIISSIGIDVRDGVVKLPVAFDGKIQFFMNYQHDLILQKDEKIKAIGSVKTSSKDRLDKIFIDKYIYNKLSGLDIPHFAIFLNDVQRKGKEPKYGVNTTFLSGHFKGYTIKLNPLDGVYYCDLRPIMSSDTILKNNIKTFDCLLVEDIWNF